jgi:predicted nucleic acid-binding protein
MTEVANALARKAIRGELPLDDALHEYGKLPLFFDEIVPIDDLIPNAIHNACRFRHPVYDLIYLEVAHRSNAQLVTADQRLFKKLAGTELSRSIALLSEWHPE